ncbi:uncharacterized protein B0H18DRAFT_1195909 [Fomitopsis serialis]|uniref:uncharacterized protein n=1 Tax=Fomitopsis serialis TaxID=139415 RepID=UPI00200785A9|nr:uncharacterized protein B0H18DRAFT_1195909 [Neoantrodia serialis]KAH9919400.1 hypothetical protein B0H18DRAFT_1195909 [Neoantrodia serialis]
MNERMNSTMIDEFLKLDWVRRHTPSFHSCHTLRSWIEVQPSGPAWQTATIKVEGYPPIARYGEPKVIFRDALECVEFLYGHPLFGPYVSTGPEVVHTQMGQRVITDFSTATLAWNMQSKLPTGAEVVGVHLGSDKLAVSSHSGDYEMHPLLLTLAGLPATIRSKLSNDAWMCIAYLPVPKFAVHTSYQGILANRVLHEAMDLVTAKLKTAARFGYPMADAYGNVRIVHPPVVALSGDLVEHLSMAAVGSSVSPVSLATSSQFGDGKVYARRTKAHTLDLIHSVSKVVDPWKLHDFQRECKKVGLNGVHMPWWRDYLFTDPSIFCVSDLLHSNYKFFFDHLLPACQIAVGAHELDRRFAARHKRIGYAALRRVSEVKQMTGRMHREIMRTTIVAIEGAVSPGFMRAMRAILDFLLAAQSPRHTPSSLAKMTTDLRTFHEHKKAIMAAGGRGSLTHWRIPKLEILSNYVPVILSHGALPQWSCDSVERLLRTEAKKPFTMFTNHRRADFGEQCARHLDRVEKMRNLELYALFKIHGADISSVLQSRNEMSDVELEDAATRGLARTLLEQALPGTGAERCIRTSRTTRNLFATGSHSATGSNVAFHLNKQPSATYAIDKVADVYKIADFRAALADYVQGLDLDARQGMPHLGSSYYQDIGLDHLCVWETYRIQVLSAYNDAVRMDPETLRAIPPSAKYPFGMCDPVIVDMVHVLGSLIAQVRVVFELIPRKGHVLPNACVYHYAISKTSSSLTSMSVDTPRRPRTSSCTGSSEGATSMPGVQFSVEVRLFH